MRDAFDRAFDYLLGDEGHVYINGPNDSGGPTKFGVTWKSYRLFVKRDVPIEEFKLLAEDQAKAFYYAIYWVPLRGDFLSSDAIAIGLFDSAVLYGLNTVARMAQTILRGDLKVDGILGDESVKALNQTLEADFISSLRLALRARIEEICQKNPKDRVYQKGWNRRADRLFELVPSLTLAADRPPNRGSPNT